MAAYGAGHMLQERGVSSAIQGLKGAAALSSHHAQLPYNAGFGWNHSQACEAGRAPSAIWHKQATRGRNALQQSGQFKAIFWPGP